MTKENWTIEIKPKKKWLDIDLKGIWRYRDLYYMYVKRDIVTVYKQTILGPLWFLIQPIFTTVMYMFIFGGLAGISTDGVPQPLFYMAGIMLWNYFSSAFNVSSNVFTANAGVFGKVYLPRLGAVVRHHLQPDQVRNTIVVVHCHVSLFLCERSFTACQCRPAVVSVPDIPNRIPCHVVGVDRIGADHQIP